MIDTCENPPSITAIPFTTESPQAIKPTMIPASATSIPVTGTHASPNVQIASMDCKSKPEIVVIENTGDSSQNMTGWRLEDEGPKFTFLFPMEFSLEAGASVELISGESGDNSDKSIFWSKRVVWNNTGDTASLFNSEGELVSKKDCP